MMQVANKVKDCQLCWAGAFPGVTACADTRMQMRRLDRVRNGMLTRVVGALRSRGKTTGGFALARHRYKGRPFSYYGFLEKAARPTHLRAMRYGGQANMDRRRPVAVLPYSEL